MLTALIENVDRAALFAGRPWVHRDCVGCLLVRAQRRDVGEQLRQRLQLRALVHRAFQVKKKVEPQECVLSQKWRKGRLPMPLRLRQDHGLGLARHAGCDARRSGGGSGGCGGTCVVGGADGWLAKRWHVRLALRREAGRRSRQATTASSAVRPLGCSSSAAGGQRGHSTLPLPRHSHRFR